MKQPMVDSIVKYKLMHNEENKNIIYISSEVYKLNRTPIELVLNALKSFEKEYKLIIRLHPDDINYNFYHSLMEEYKISNYLIDQEGCLYEILVKSDLIIGTRSTVLLEALLLDKKVITIVSNEYELLSILNNSNKLKNNEQNVLNFISRYFYKVDGKVCDRIVKQI
ncbi:glycerophosphotransferase [Clostridium botulinum]|nr:glycerophosphotransferase [Clostridium botulinum]